MKLKYKVKYIENPTIKFMEVLQTREYPKVKRDISFQVELKILMKIIL